MKTEQETYFFLCSLQDKHSWLEVLKQVEVAMILHWAEQYMATLCSLRSRNGELANLLPESIGLDQGNSPCIRIVFHQLYHHQVTPDVDLAVQHDSESWLPPKLLAHFSCNESFRQQTKRRILWRAPKSYLFFFPLWIA